MQVAGTLKPFLLFLQPWNEGQASAAQLDSLAWPLWQLGDAIVTCEHERRPRGGGVVVAVEVSPRCSFPFLLAGTCMHGCPALAMIGRAVLGVEFRGPPVHGEVPTSCTAHLHLDTVQ